MTAHAHPLQRFAELYEAAALAQPKDPNAMVVASVGDDGRPSSRVVLLKGFDERGFVFYTNFHSRKGGELLRHPFAALLFYWPALDCQVRIEGSCGPVEPAEADAYFATRARLSQLGAWASEQSRPLESREALDARVVAFEKQFDGQPVPRPPHWSGFRVVPERFEFWKGVPNRLHDRFVYVRDGADWSVSRLFP